MVGGVHWYVATPFTVGSDPLMPVPSIEKATDPLGIPAPSTACNTVGVPAYKFAGHRIATVVSAVVANGCEIGLVDEVKLPLLGWYVATRACDPPVPGVQGKPTVAVAAP